MLNGSTRTCLFNKPNSFIYSWENLCHAVLNNFECCYTKPGKEDDLHHLFQTSNENLHQFAKRFVEDHNTIPNINDDSVIRAFKQAIWYESFTKDLYIHPQRFVSKLFDMQTATPKPMKPWNGIVWLIVENAPLQPGLEEVKKKDSKKPTRPNGHKGEHKEDKPKSTSREVAIVEQWLRYNKGKGQWKRQASQ